jgi:ABC-type antimicrobial peptide transport system permease subunit
MANFLKAKVGDPINVLLARATDNQVELEMRLVGIFERLPGFPDGADALINIATHTDSVPSKNPDFFLAATADGDDPTLATALSSLQLGPATVGQLQIDSRLTTLARDQSSLAALNIAGLIDLDSTFALAMVVVTIAVFVFGLLLQRRREYVTLRAQGLEPRTIRLLIAAEAGSVAVAGSISGVIVGAAMGFYFVTVLRPLFVLTPSYSLPLIAGVLPIVLVLAAATLTSLVGSRLVNKLAPTELLRDE